MMSPRQYGAALMQAYLGKASLQWVAELVGLPLEVLRSWRREPKFLLVMDWSKSAFSEAFRESLMVTDYSLSELEEIAGEFSLLEDSLRIAGRTRLYQILRNLGQSLGSRHRSGLSLERDDLQLFRRLFLFFLVLEHYWPSPARSRLQEQFLPLAREVVWPLLGLGDWVEPGPRYSWAHLRELVAGELRKSFEALPQVS